MIEFIHIIDDKEGAILLSNSLKLGADVGIVAGPVGTDASAASANLSADILSRRAVTDSQAERLIEAVRKATGKK